MTAVSKGLFISQQGKPGEMETAVKDAIDIGYRHFDSAMIYGNEHEIGAAVRAKIADGTVKREDLFITNKVNRKYHCRSSSSLVPVGRS
jgi:diketogulonate reductase-like aldo/keto reductase